MGEAHNHMDKALPSLCVNFSDDAHPSPLLATSVNIKFASLLVRVAISLDSKAT